MEIKEFPKTMDRLLGEQQSAELMNANEVSRENQRQVQKNINEQRSRRDNRTEKGMFGGALAGFIIGFIACTAICVGDDPGGVFNDAPRLFGAPATWIFCTVLGAPIGIFLVKFLALITQIK